jgi:CelD/BcsL family acetyltransferase involved in cellulose biosynthesis
MTFEAAASTHVVASELLTARIEQGWSAFGSLQHEWNDLLVASRANSIFLRWEWIDAWRKTVGTDIEPLLVVLRDQTGRLAGLGAFYRTRSHLVGTIPYRALRILGDLDSGAEYQDWILRQDVEHAAIEALGAALARLNGWDWAWFPYVATWTGAHDRLFRAATSSQLLIQEKSAEFSELELPATYQQYLASLSGNARSMLKRRAQQIMKAPGMRFTCCSREEERGAYLDALFELHARRWTAAGLPGSFVRRPAMTEFYREFSRIALERNWLRIFALRDGDRFTAIQFGYVYNGTFYQLQEGFEPEGPEGIGNVLRSHVIQSCIAEGVRSYDFLGGYTEHKRRWGARLRMGRHVLVGRKTVKNLPLFTIGIWPTGKYLKLDRPAVG